MLGAVLDLDHPQASDSLDVLEHLMALEEEFGTGAAPDVSEASVASWQRAALSALLGAAARHCTWEPNTIGARSPRGIINERVRWRGGCSCAVEEGAVRTMSCSGRGRAHMEPRR